MAGLTGETQGLFRRCLSCDPNANPTCPVCAADETCTLISPSCNACASTQCSKIGASSNSDTQSIAKSPPKSAAGPIAGGVVGGIALIVLVTFFVWRFCIKKRREEWHQKYWQDPAANTEKENEDFGAQRDARASTHTVGSIASTVLTRASNIIQIAYIPGVTNRSDDTSPELIPPVPPIPAASPSHATVGTPHAQQQNDHYFMPADIRGSTFSGYTNDDRTSYARSSMAPSHPRSSVATYRGNVNPTPAQMVMRGKAIPISLKSTTPGNNSPTETPGTATPPVPAINLQRNGSNNLQRNGSNHSPIVARLGVPRAVTVTRSASNNNMSSTVSPLSRENPSPSNSEASQAPLAQPPRRVSVADSIRHDGNSSTFDDASSSDEDSPAEASLMGWDNEKQHAASKLGHSPFKTPASAPDLRRGATPSSPPDSRGYASESRQKRHKRSGSLNQIIEEATRRASREPRHGGLGSIGSLAGWKRAETAGPFSDAHAAGTP